MLKAIEESFNASTSKFDISMRTNANESHLAAPEEYDQDEAFFRRNLAMANDTSTRKSRVATKRKSKSKVATIENLDDEMGDDSIEVEELEFEVPMP